MQFILYGKVLLISTLLLFSNSLCAQQVSYPELEYNFGVVKQGEKVTHDFSISNNGNEDLIIRKISSACGCTSAVAESAIIPAGGKSHIRVVFDTTDFIGEKVKTIRVYTNDPMNTSQVILIKANVQPEVISIPDRIEFHDIILGEERSANFIFKKLEGLDVKITDASSRSDNLSLVFNKQTEQLSVKVLPKTPKGKYNEHVSVKTTSKTTPVVNIPIFFEVVGKSVVNPQFLNFGLITSKSDESRYIKTFVIKNRDGSDIEDISNLGSENQFISVSKEPRANQKEIVVRVSLNPRGSSIVRGEVEFKVDGDETLYEVPFSAVIDN